MNFIYKMIVLVVLLVPHLALAGGTVAGTSISNLAVLSYSLGGIAQTDVESSPTGNTTSGAGAGTNTVFIVDQKVDFTVAAIDAAAVGALPGSVGNILTFSVTNTGNAIQDFVLTATTVATASNAAFAGKLDAIDAGTLSLFVDVNANGTYELATDTATFIDELAVDAYTHVFMLSGIIPNVAQNDEVASYHLLATAHIGGVAGQGALAVETAAGSETLAAVDVLFADAQGSDTANEALVDGIHSAQSDFIVSSAEISITKTALVLSDPVNGTTTPQAIPGATVEYKLDVVNAATASEPATLTVITDAIQADLSVVAAASAFGSNPIGWSWTDGTNTVSGTLLADGTATDATDGLDYAVTTAGEITYDATVLLTSANAATALPAGLPARIAAGDLQAGETLSLTFQVIIK